MDLHLDLTFPNMFEAELHPEAEVVGVDLSPIQPE